MNKNNRIIFFIILTFFLEVILKSSGIDFFYNLEPLIIICLVYQEKRERSNFIFALFIFFTLILEIINFNFLGLRALLFSSIYLLINLLSGIIKLIKRNINFKISLILLLVLILIQVFTGIYRSGLGYIDFGAILGNFILYIIIYNIFNKIIPNRYII